MKVYRDGKEVKDAKVVYHPTGEPFTVTVDGTNYDAGVFEFRDEESNKKTKPATHTKKVSGEVMSTEDLERK